MYFGREAMLSIHLFQLRKNNHVTQEIMKPVTAHPP
jgi:hypothetical protein